MPAESSPFAFPKLDGSNYTSWKEDMKVVLMDRGCWSFIIEDKPCPEQATEKEKFERLPAEYDHLVQTLYRLKDEEFNHREVEKQLVNEAGRIQLKQKYLNLDYTEIAYTVGSFRLQETSKKFSERSGAVLDPSRNPGQYRKIHYPKGMGPSCDCCSRKGHDASKCYKKRNKEKKQAFASETSFCGTNQAFGVSTDWNQFLIDTAATSHFCYERDWFRNFKELKTTKALLADKKSACEVRGIGDIDFIVKDIKEYLSRVQRELGRKLKSVRTDNGLVFCHKDFETFFRNLGICIERTSFYTPELNGIAERFNRSSMEAVRTMLLDSGLQPRFWAEALHAYVHTKNRCSHKLTEGKTPMEIWSGHKPSIRHCRTFGSLAYVYVPTVNRNKLQPKAKIGILVGYAVNRRGYRVWLPKERKVVESIHVKIDETKNGVKALFGKVKHYVYAIYQLDQNLNNDSDCRAQDEKSSSPEKPSLLDMSTRIRLEKPRKKSKRIDVYYYPPSKEQLISINDVKMYCEKNKLEFDPNQFNFKPTTTNTRFAEKSECYNETNSDSVDEASFVNDIFQHEIYMTEIPKTFKETQISPDKEKWDEAMSEEIKLMQNRKVWDLVETKSNMKVLGCRWVYNIKHDEKNNVKKYKSRLVAQGYGAKTGC
ncbi:Retrovirus-related Pol polyprotein from transposon TNT 1-94 [Araneus ventricosus]|uniref:Retrovirus-related Pol polyprotein from transposon TNT 1-94 n=1 Tax=Araneus ventricosus TaxID=182803 RepID=A0A4Y2PZZ7_ARAVE|nr:Retrovirus-related Pol polyprotein from transposon TNT 1-94 [Araneus ventricosus]